MHMDYKIVGQVESDNFTMWGTGCPVGPQATAKLNNKLHKKIIQDSILFEYSTFLKLYHAIDTNQNATFHVKACDNYQVQADFGIRR